MGLRLRSGKNVALIDGSLPGIVARTSSPCREEVFWFCRKLREYGVDWFEVSRASVRALGGLPEDLNAVLRAEGEADLEFLDSAGISACIVPWILPWKQTGVKGDQELKAEISRLVPQLQQLKEAGIAVTLELSAATDREALFCAGRIVELVQYADSVRIAGLEYTELNPEGPNTWLEDMRRQFGGGVGIGICPGNGLSMASAIAVEAVMNGADSISCTFAGIGSNSGMNFAPLEEVLLAADVLQLLNTEICLETLPDMVQLFSKWTGYPIHPLKPVLGKHIFQYESGIHADGIDKNPVTYEPYAPERVGLKRMLALGKHSGRRSVIGKLREMGLECGGDMAEALLPMVREKSVEAGRSLTETEILELYQQYTLQGPEGIAK